MELAAETTLVALVMEEIRQRIAARTLVAGTRCRRPTNNLISAGDGRRIMATWEGGAGSGPTELPLLLDENVGVGD